MTFLSLFATVLTLTVTDPSGLPMAVSGHIENLASGVSTRVRTDAQGHASIDLLVGRYRLSLAHPGFGSQVQMLALAGPLSKTVTMTVGASSYSVDIVSPTPLPGLDRARDSVPAPLQTASDRDLTASGALDLSDFANRRLGGVYLNEIQGNPLQPDLNYRGYTASPLLGTPQGVSIFLDGVRLNQPFGDVVSWDLIPRVAIAEMALIPGSNPVFGLNTLGGSLALRSKDGRSHPGSALTLNGGSFGRKIAEFEHGGFAPRGFHWYTAGNLFFEDGWRETSPSNVRQLFTKVGWQGQRTSVGMSMAYANNALLGNGLQEQRFLLRKYSSVYTRPDVTAHRSPLFNLSVQHALARSLTFSGNSYFRYIRTGTLNGDSNEDSFDQAVYQPNAAERAALTAAGYTGVPAAGENAVNTPFPKWRCIANVLLRDEPEEKCNGLLNRSNAHQRNYGLSGQLSWTHQRQQVTAGAAYDGNSVNFGQSTEFGYLNPDRSVSPLGAFAVDSSVNLSSRIHTASVFAVDTIRLGRSFNLTVSGRFNRTTIDNLDRIQPLAGTGSLTGSHVFSRLNPSVGITYRGLYASYSEGSRAPTAIELGCADPASPCRLPNALAGDPPLRQVVTRTVEAGVRSTGEGRLRWNLGWFRADNRNDLLFVASPQTGFGYFKNFGQTLRQGLEAGVSARIRRVILGTNYTFLDATFRSPEIVNGRANSSNREGLVAIASGQRIPLVPHHMTKAYADVQVTSKFVVNLGVVGISGAIARGNENGQHQPDGRLYIGPGASPGYAVANLGGRYDLHRRLQVFAQINNLFDRQYYSGAQLGPTGFTADGSYIARPFPSVGRVFPVRHATFYAPGAPRGIWGGIRLRF